MEKKREVKRFSTCFSTPSETPRFLRPTMVCGCSQHSTRIDVHGSIELLIETFVGRRWSSLITIISGTARKRAATPLGTVFPDRAKSPVFVHLTRRKHDRRIRRRLPLMSARQRVARKLLLQRGMTRKNEYYDSSTAGSSKEPLELISVLLLSKRQTPTTPLLNVQRYAYDDIW